MPKLFPEIVLLRMGLLLPLAIATPMPKFSVMLLPKMELRLPW